MMYLSPVKLEADVEFHRGRRWIFINANMYTNLGWVPYIQMGSILNQITMIGHYMHVAGYAHLIK